ncbi:MAG TPA: glutathione S-transferase N-terminal domain-containing protein, partial [Terriglobales bacterium]|nr:glutathione S-transferase N-terminal domain-containing protein [Terriglobales bacterium]
MTNARPFQVFGLMHSYFTRKMTGYLDHKGIWWILRRTGGVPPAPLAARGFPGGIPAIETPDGVLMWDSSAMIEYLDSKLPGASVIPHDPTLRFLCYLLDDIIDEWFYRPAVGSRWFVEANTQSGGYELGREMSVVLPLSADQAQAMTAAFMRSSCGPLGVSAENISSWLDDALRPWIRVLG